MSSEDIGLLLLLHFLLTAQSFLFLFVLFLGISSGEVTLLNMTEGQQASMECTFSTSSTSDYYFNWYRQYPGLAPQFILYRGYSSPTANFAEQRFEANADRGKTILTISKLNTEDSAFYYCALTRLTLIY